MSETAQKVIKEHNGYTLVRREVEDECDHFACHTLHRHLYNRYGETRRVDLYSLSDDYYPVGSRNEARYHFISRVEWVVVDPQGWAVSVETTKRAAVTEFDVASKAA